MFAAAGSGAEAAFSPTTLSAELGFDRRQGLRVFRLVCLGDLQLALLWGWAGRAAAAGATSVSRAAVAEPSALLWPHPPPPVITL
eukprot:gene3145-biopygen632